MDALEHVAHMTRSRDRVLIDTTLVTALLDLVPQLARVQIWRLVADGQGERRWLPGAAQVRGDLVALTGTDDPQWEELNLVDALPAHAQVLAQQAPVRQETVDAQGRALQLCVMPMPTDHSVDGVIELQSATPFDPLQERLVQGVLRIVHNFRSLLDDSERDTLTGLLNRKCFDEAFLRATVVDSAQGGGADADRRRGGTRRYWLGVLDIDHFKRVNDEYGHLIGDEVLVLVARILRNTFRYNDRAFRFGGEEFVVLLCAPDAQAAGAAFERLRHNMASFEFPRAGRVTGSIGYSDVRAGDTPQSAFDRADRATYYAKQHGRNQVHSHEELVAQGVLDTGPGPGAGDIELF